MISLPPSFAIVEVAPHVTESVPHEGTSSSSVHEADSSSTFTGNDADNLSNYRAPYPVWMYTTHPSTECETRNKNCPPTDPAKQKDFERSEAMTTVAVMVVFVVIAVAFVALIMMV